MEEEKTKFLELYEYLDKTLLKDFNQIVGDLDAFILDCKEEIESEGYILAKRLDKILNPVDKLRDNLDYLKGLLLIVDRKERQPPEGVLSLDTYCEDKNPASMRLYETISKNGEEFQENSTLFLDEEPETDNVDLGVMRAADIAKRYGEFGCRSRK